MGAIGYSGTHVIEICRDLLSRAFRGLYPVKTEVLAALVTPGVPDHCDSPEEVVTVMEHMISDFESKLGAYEATRNT